MPLQGQRTRCHCCAIVGCHCSVLWLGEEGDDQLGAIAGCNCRVPLLVCYGGGAANFEGVDVVPLQGAIVVCYGLGGG